MDISEGNIIGVWKPSCLSPQQRLNIPSDRSLSCANGIQLIKNYLFLWIIEIHHNCQKPSVWPYSVSVIDTKNNYTLINFTIYYEMQMKYTTCNWTMLICYYSEASVINNDGYGFKSVCITDTCEYGTTTKWYNITLIWLCICFLLLSKIQLQVQWITKNRNVRSLKFRTLL